MAIAGLKWETIDTAEGQLGTTKSTMGRQITSEVKGVGDIPPEVAIEFEPFPALAEQISKTVVVDCSVVIDPGERKIHVRPYPGQVDLAKSIAVEALRKKVAELLGADDKVVFAGTP